jgi:lipid-A-disaccharide synthase
MVKKVCIIAGEPSGDLYGGRMIHELKKLSPELEAYGIGGDKMDAEGVKLLYHIRQMSFMGFLEIIRHLPFINKVMSSVVEYTKNIRPDVVILIDYPGFNLKIAEKIKPYCNKVVYYISPQLWAWGKHRIKKIKRLIDKIIVIFPFEKDFYKDENIEVDFVGHPLLEMIDEYNYTPKHEFFEKHKFKENQKIMAVFPGSRLQEVKKHLPVINEVLKTLLEKENLNIAVAMSPNISEEIYKAHITDERIKLIDNEQYNLLKYSDFALIKSGTSTVEAACFEVPMIIFYKASAFSYYIGRLLVKIKFFGMVNIIAGRKIVTELLQSEVNTSNLVKHCLDLLNNENLSAKIKMDLRDLKTKLGVSGASKRAAEIIYNVC